VLAAKYLPVNIQAGEALFFSRLGNVWVPHWTLGQFDTAVLHGIGGIVLSAPGAR